MSLKFNSSNKTSLISRNSITQAYKNGWNFIRSKGNYNSGIDFFSIHWEVNSDSPNIIRFHVESPREEVDQNLNNLKFEIITDIKDNLKHAESLLKKGTLVNSLRSNNEKNIRNNKSSEVFHVSLDESYDYPRVKEAVNLVNNDLNQFLDQFILKHTERIKKLNLRDTY